MARMQFKTKESSINYSNTRTDWENKGMEAKERERDRGYNLMICYWLLR